MKILTILIAVLLDSLIPSGQAFLHPLQKRDSVLVADQFEYGFKIDSLGPGSVVAPMDFLALSNDTLTVVADWKFDTLSVARGRKNPNHLIRLEGHVVIAPFEEGVYNLPPIYVLLRKEETASVDTLVFDPSVIEVKAMPVDTATYVPHDIKGQILYPITFKEILPYILGVLFGAAVIFLLVWYIRRVIRKRKGDAGKTYDPPYIVALRQLDKYRGESYWAPEKQKDFYSGVTDALRAYIESRFGVDAMEMTSSELFDSLKGDQTIPHDLFEDMKRLFETADFVKFAKHSAPDSENAKALPVAVRFVTSTYQAEVEAESSKDGGEAAEK